MKGLKSKYEQTKVADEPLVKELTSVQDIFSIISIDESGMDVDFEGVDYGRLREIISDKADFILSLLSSCLKRDMLPEEL